MRLRYSRLALVELDSILSDLADKSPNAAKRFADRIDLVGQRIGRFPNGFQEMAERPGVRRVPLVRYFYLIFYKIIAGEVVVLRVVHGARKEPWENL